jgi:hypothetical protein
MKWPSTKFFQALAASSFMLAMGNAFYFSPQARTSAIEIKNRLDNIEQTLGSQKAEEIANSLFSYFRNQMSNQNFIIFKETFSKIAENNENIQQYSVLRDQYVNNQIMYQYYQNQIDNLNLENNTLIHYMTSNNDFMGSLSNSAIVSKDSVSQAVKDLINSKGGWGNHLNNPFEDIYNNFNSWLSSLDYTHSVAVVNITGLILLFLSVLQIIFIFYGTYLLDYLNLEKRYPKLANIIILRRKFQQYYLLLNISIIVLTIFIMLYFNLTLFTIV